MQRPLLKNHDLYQRAKDILLGGEDIFSLYLIIKGIVQGVGFRPFVYRIAMQYSLKGEVSNNSDGVEIKISGDRNSILSFLWEIQESPPPLSVIREIHIEKIKYIPYDSFRIKESEKGHSYEIDITNDIATCSDCLKEMADTENFRYGYPFINCTNCGPRYSIIQDLPYDRPATTMRSFAMCQRCQKEYHDPGNRRFHAQPIACPECGPSLSLLDFDGKLLEDSSDKNIIDHACFLLQEGNILAIKGLGGFHLACRADLDAPIIKLRQRKRREEKPFAIMVKDMGIAERIAWLSQEEKSILSCFASPIVLVRRKKKHPCVLFFDRP